MNKRVLDDWLMFAVVTVPLSDNETEVPADVDRTDESLIVAHWEEHNSWVNRDEFESHRHEVSMPVLFWEVSSSSRDLIDAISAYVSALDCRSLYSEGDGVDPIGKRSEKKVCKLFIFETSTF